MPQRSHAFSFLNLIAQADPVTGLSNEVHTKIMKTCEFSLSKCAVLSLNSTGLPLRRVAKNFNFFEQEKSIKVEGMKRVETMFTSVTTENQDAKSSLEVMMIERTVTTFASWACFGW